MDSSTSFSGLRVTLLLVGGSSEVERVGHGGNLGDEEHETQCFSEGDSIGGGLVSVEAVPVPSKIASM